MELLYLVIFCTWIYIFLLTRTVHSNNNRALRKINGFKASFRNRVRWLEMQLDAIEKKIDEPIGALTDFESNNPTILFEGEKYFIINSRQPETGGTEYLIRKDALVKDSGFWVREDQISQCFF